MKNTLRKFQAALILLIILSLQTKAFASACNQDIRVPIAFPKGSYCWSFLGKGTTFYGNFAGGQRVSVSMRGWNGNSWEFIYPGASDRRNFYVSDQNDRGQIDFTTPHAGYYEFGFYPCVFWGATVQIKICAI